LKSGDRVTWHFSASGPYGLPVSIAGIVRKITPQRVTIEFARQEGREWVRERKSVATSKLSPRSKSAAELGESE
jgi:hypothetical protein